MNSKKYQEYIKKFDKYPKELNLVMYALGLGGETGETLEKIKKLSLCLLNLFQFFLTKLKNNSLNFLLIPIFPKIKG